jgi:hypothetical protein
MKSVLQPEPTMKWIKARSFSDWKNTQIDRSSPEQPETVINIGVYI